MLNTITLLMNGFRLILFRTKEEGLRANNLPLFDDDLWPLSLTFLFLVKIYTCKNAITF